MRRALPGLGAVNRRPGSHLHWLRWRRIHSGWAFPARPNRRRRGAKRAGSVSGGAGRPVMAGDHAATIDPMPARCPSSATRLLMAVVVMPMAVKLPSLRLARSRAPAAGASCCIHATRGGCVGSIRGSVPCQPLGGRTIRLAADRRLPPVGRPVRRRADRSSSRAIINASRRPAACLAVL